ncbi:hypothetical protein BOX15_Mlig032984g1 [Macrostomum lignano]|uniref:Amiloride-sensitive sodium channel n=2 Tax=Macrostomum lignano TaxID=282301 RepID=A0A267ETM1_9PLAT|nr:hypothetical protein BOX15_Mlig032984g1 [Macrostomum lignano]
MDPKSDMLERALEEADDSDWRTDLGGDPVEQRRQLGSKSKSRHNYRRRMLCANLQSFAHRTSAHGLGRFFSQQVPWLRGLWALVVFGAMTGLTLHTYKQISLFRAYPVSSTTRLLTNRFTFPDVTFCDPLMKKFFTIGSRQLRSDVNRNNYFVANYMLGYLVSDEERDDEASSRVKAIKLAYATFEHAVHTWPKFNMTAASARIFDMLLYCQYNQERCTGKNFTVFYHRDYGNCFSFKATNRFIRSSGVEKGLVLVLYSPSVDVKQSIDYYSDTVTTGLETGGLRVAVHQQDTIPYPSEYGINSPSGMQTVLALNQVQTSLANTPTKRCEPKGRFHAFDHLLGSVTSYENQLADCTTFEYLKLIRDNCKCTVEGLVKSEPDGQPQLEYCHDLLGAQNKPDLLSLLQRIREFFETDPSIANYSLLDRSTGRMRTDIFDRLHLPDRFDAAQLLADRFPEIQRRLNRLKCAMPYLKSGRKQSSCLNICNYTTYDFSVFQSRWPDHNFQIRGARIRLARIAGMLKSRVDEINKMMQRKLDNYASTEHALNFSITHHRVNLSRCLDTELDRKSDLFEDDEHCVQVHNIIKQSFLQLRVYPKTLTVRQLFEERSYELVNLFSDLGGIMGLWIGVSMVTLCEFAEISLILCSYYALSVVRRVSNALSSRRTNEDEDYDYPTDCHGNHCEAADKGQQRSFAAANSDPWTELQSPLLVARPTAEGRAASQSPSDRSDLHRHDVASEPQLQQSAASAPSSRAASPDSRSDGKETRL